MQVLAELLAEFVAYRLALRREGLRGFFPLAPRLVAAALRRRRRRLPIQKEKKTIRVKERSYAAISRISGLKRFMSWTV